jgi:hypothetical protein
VIILSLSMIQALLRRMQGLHAMIQILIQAQLRISRVGAHKSRVAGYNERSAAMAAGYTLPRGKDEESLRALSQLIHDIDSWTRGYLHMDAQGASPSAPTDSYRTSRNRRGSTLDRALRWLRLALQEGCLEYFHHI